MQLFCRVIVGLFLWFSILSPAYSELVGMDLSNPKYPIMATYNAEAYVALNVYDQSESNEGSKYFYTTNKHVTLLDYISNPLTGFNGAIYQTSDGKYIIAFGGTIASSSSYSNLWPTWLSNLLDLGEVSQNTQSKLDIVSDVITDLNLLNSRLVTNQPYDAHAYALGWISTYGLDNTNTTITGHSLGGGLAQHVSALESIKAVTFNTAPFPFPYHSLFDVDLDATNIVNIMTDQDELTATLEVIEDVENGGHDPSIPSHGGDVLSLASDIMKDVDTIENKLALLGIVKDNVAFDLISSILSGVSGGSGDPEVAQSYNQALNALKDEDEELFVAYLKSAFGLTATYKKLILGQRYILPTGTQHSMSKLIAASYDDHELFGLLRIKETLPELYDYIDTEFTGNGTSLPADTALSQDLGARLRYYFYTKAHKEHLRTKWELYLTMVDNAIEHQEQVQDFADTYLNVNGILTQSTIAVADAFVGRGYIDENFKEDAAKLIVDSGAGEFLGLISDDEKSDYARIIENCVGGSSEVAWVTNASSVIAGATIKSIPEKLVDCVAGEGVSMVFRYANTARGFLALHNYYSYLLASELLNEYMICGSDYDCVKRRLGGSESYFSQLQYLMDNNEFLGRGALDIAVKIHALTVFLDYTKTIEASANVILSYMPPALQSQLQYSNSYSSGLDVIIEPAGVVSNDDASVEFNADFFSASDKDIEIVNIGVVKVQDGEELDLTSRVAAAGLLSSEIEAQGSSSHSINVGFSSSDKVDGEFRLVFFIQYQSVESGFEGAIQRVVDIIPSESGSGGTGAILTPGNTLVNAVSIPNRNSEFSTDYEYISGSESHWWKLDAKAGEGVTVALTGHLSSGDLDVHLFNEDGESINYTSNVYGGELQYLSEDIGYTGTYFIRVSGGSSTSGSYDLAVYSHWSNDRVTDDARDFNSTLGTAYYLSGGTKVIQNSPNGAMIRDAYRFTASAGNTVTIGVTAQINTGDLNAYLYNQQGTNIASVTNIYDGYSKTISEAITASGVYYLIVTGDSDASGSYDLLLGGVENDKDTDGDHLKDAAEYVHGTNLAVTDSDGDGRSDLVELIIGTSPTAVSTYLSADIGKTMATATDIPYENDLINATYRYINGSASHWWRFNAKAGEGVTVAMTGHLNSSDLDVYLFNENGETINYTTNVYDGELQYLSEDISYTGTYFIRVSGNASTSGSYDLAVYSHWSNASASDSARDFNSTLGTAYYLSSGTKVIDNSPNGAMIQDAYRFTASAGNTVTIGLTAQINTGDLNAYLYNQRGTTIAYVTNIYDGYTKTISEAITASGVYYLIVTGDSDAAGSYDLSLDGVENDKDTDGDYLEDAAEYVHGTSLTVKDSDGDGRNDFVELSLGTSPTAVSTYLSGDIGKTMATATDIPYENDLINATYRYINGSASHWWRFNAKAGEGVTVALTGHLNSGDLDVYLFNEDGESIDYIANIYDGELQYFVEGINYTGTYFIRVSGNSSTSGSYDLAVYSHWSNASASDSARDFNSTLGTAYYLSSGTKVIDNSPNGAMIRDAYRFTASAGDTVTIGLTAQINTGDLNAHLYNQQGTVIAYATNVYDGYSKTISEAITASGVYYLIVTGDSEASGSYDLSLNGAIDDNDSDNIADSVDLDDDNDGIPDVWEIKYGFDPFDSSDALDDPDQDGLNNFGEYSNGTDPDIKDTDSDGINDNDEVEAGTDPTTPKLNNNAVMVLPVILDMLLN